MNKKELLKAISEKTEQTQGVIDAIITAYVEVLFETLKADKDATVTLPKVGTFKVKHVPEKTGTIMLGDNKGGKWVKPAHDEIAFTIAKSVKEI